MLSSLPYQILLYLGGWLSGGYILSELLLLTYKLVILPYPVGNWISELLLLVFLSGCEASRILLAKKGNLTARTLSSTVSLLLALPCILAVVYMLVWQTYILKIEVILCATMLVFQGLHVFFGILVTITFIRADPMYM